MKTTLIRIIIFLFITNLSAEISIGIFDSLAASNAKNIILFIGDGMGAEHRKAARLNTVGSFGKLSMDDMSASGSLQTRSADNPITDSAAAATAMATGVKTNNGVLSLDTNLCFLSTILEDAKRQGKRVGLVTTTQITDATPAAFATHIEDRNLVIEIAEQILGAGVDVLLGGGEDEFIPTFENGCFPESGERNDGRNLINEAIAIGYRYVCDPASFRSLDPYTTIKLFGIFADQGMLRPFDPSLAEMTQKAIAILSKGSSGFFLMVEGGQIDWASHSNDATNTISDTVGLDEAVAIAKQFASLSNDTLIIVTADHETGGMMVSFLPSGLPSEDGPFRTPDGKQFYINWSTTGHTASDVPVTSLGPLSGILNGIHDNTFINEVMLTAFGND